MLSSVLYKKLDFYCKVCRKSRISHHSSLFFVIIFLCIVVPVPEISWLSPQLTYAAAEHKIPPLLCCLKKQFGHKHPVCLIVSLCYSSAYIYPLFLVLYEIIRFLGKRALLLCLHRIQHVGGLFEERSSQAYWQYRQIIINATVFSLLPQFKE